MNIVFWLAIGVIGVAIWLLFRPVFGAIGRAIKGEVDYTRDEMNDVYEEEDEER